MRRFGSGPKPGVARAVDHLTVRLAVDARSVADTVVAGEVRGCLRRGDEVVARHAVAIRERQVTLADLGAEPTRMLEGALERCPYAGLDRVEIGDLLRHREPHPGERVPSGSRTSSGSSAVVESSGSRPAMIE